MTASAISLTSVTNAQTGRKRFLHSLAERDRANATHRLIREYLPALRAMLAETTPAALDAELHNLEDRLAAGFTYEGQGVDKWFRLLERYEILSDCRNLEYQGTDRHPTRYLAERIGRQCQP